MKILLWALVLSMVLASLVEVVLYWWDKRAAKREASRIRERTLHLWALAGGWPGALAARQWFRHKTQKQPFGLILWATMVAHVGIWSGLLWWVWQR